VLIDKPGAFRCCIEEEVAVTALTLELGAFGADDTSIANFLFGGKDTEDDTENDLVSFSADAAVKATAIRGLAVDIVVADKVLLLAAPATGRLGTSLSVFFFDDEDALLPTAVAGAVDAVVDLGVFPADLLSPLPLTGILITRSLALSGRELAFFSLTLPLLLVVEDATAAAERGGAIVLLLLRFDRSSCRESSAKLVIIIASSTFPVPSISSQSCDATLKMLPKPSSKDKL
jgi:hypothetical protein